MKQINIMSHWTKSVENMLTNLAKDFVTLEIPGDDVLNWLDTDPEMKIFSIKQDNNEKEIVGIDVTHCVICSPTIEQRANSIDKLSLYADDDDNFWFLCSFGDIVEMPNPGLKQ